MYRAIGSMARGDSEPVPRSQGVPNKRKDMMLCGVAIRQPNISCVGCFVSIYLVFALAAVIATTVTPPLVQHEFQGIA